MPMLRVVVVALTLTAVAIAPLFWGDSGTPRDGRTAYATAIDGFPGDGSSVRQSNDNGDDNGNGNDNGGDNGNANDNDDNNNGNANGNDNDDNGNDNNGNGNGNGNGNNNGNGNGNDNGGDDNDNEDGGGPAPVAAPQAGGGAGAGGGDAFPASRCYDVGMVGAINLSLAGGGVTLDVVPVSSFPRVSRVMLSPVDPASVPPASGGFLAGFVFDVRAQEGCDGPALGQLPSAVNLGIAYSVPADKGRLRIARWDGGRWVDVTTVPDPNPTNPYISATIQQTGTYAVYQAP